MEKRFRLFERLFHGLHLYGAAGIAAFGWSICRLLDWQAAPWLPLWFCAALLIYNADRLRHDPADKFNVPLREATTRRFRAASFTLLTVALALLVIWPAAHRDWMTLGLVVAGGVICLNYSIPILGFRFKELPLIKTLFAPSVVTLSVVALPWLHERTHHDALTLAITTGRAWAFLLFNMTLCDLRDIEGDRLTGIRSLPVLCGTKWTHRFLWALLGVIELLAVAGLLIAGEQHRSTWRWIVLASPLYLGALLVAARQPRTERFYEWWVEGMLFLPAAAALLGAL
ncbi:MAG: UbiA family prenyltransferase [Verrucomicrobiota bacterium]